MDKEWKKLLKRYGFKVVGVNSKSHPIVEHENGSRTTVACSPGGGRSLKNAESHLRKVANGYYLQPAR